MKRIIGFFIISIISVILFGGCSKKGEVITGEIEGSSVMKSGLFARALGASSVKGYIYMIKDEKTNSYYGLMSQRDVLRDGDIGTYTLGRGRYVGSFKENVKTGNRVDLVDRRFTVYELASYEFMERGPEKTKMDFLKKIAKGFSGQFKEFLLIQVLK